MNTALLNRLLSQAKAAKNPEEKAWIATETLLQSLEPELRQASWAVAVTHWFDTEIIGVLCPELKARAAEIYNELQTLPFVEVFPDRGHNIHEATRKQILERLWQNEREKFRTLSARAAEYFAESDDSSEQIEGLYHLAVSDREDVAEELWNFCWNLNNTFRYGELDAIANTLFEQGEANRVSLDIKGVIYFFKGQAEQRAYKQQQALQTFGQALNFYREIGARLGEANTLQAIGDILQFLDRREEALENYQSALTFYRDIGDRLGEANVLQEYGKLQNNSTEARKYFSSAQKIFIQIGDKYSQCRNLLFIASTLMELKRKEEAIEALEQGATLAEEINYEPLRNYALEQIKEIRDS